LWHPDILYCYAEEEQKPDDPIWGEALELRDQLATIVEAEEAAESELEATTPAPRRLRSGALRAQ
jgi:hypothetical protein